jgi:hypothetical protein
MRLAGAGDHTHQSPHTFPERNVASPGKVERDIANAPVTQRALDDRGGTIREPGNHAGALRMGRSPDERRHEHHVGRGDRLCPQ